MATNGFLGLRGTGDWTVTGQRPKSWREGILFHGPNGSAPLVAITSMGKSKKVDDPEFNWFRKELPGQVATIVAGEVYTNSVLGSAYSSGGVAGTVLYAKMTQDASLEFRAGHVVRFRDANYSDMTCNAEVIDSVQAGASSYIAVVLLEADDNGVIGTTNISDADSVSIIGNLNPEHGEMPDIVGYDPTRLYNYTQIIRTPLALSRTALETHLRTGNAYKEEKREKLELHSIEIEKTWLWGTKFEGTGTNGKPKRTTGGLEEFIRTNASGNVSDFSLESAYSADTWATSGKDWLNGMFELIFRKGTRERLALCGSTALQAINDLAETWGDVTIKVRQPAYGIEVSTWHTVHGTVHFKSHPLMTQNSVTRAQCFILDPRQISFRYVTDTKFIDDKNGRNSGSRDGLEEEFLTEAGLEFGIPELCGFLSGFGKTNIV